MAQIEVWYEGQLGTKCVHLQSGDVIRTDAPVDNKGKGEKFSPTDLVGAALGSCVLTIMGIQADALKVDIVGTKAEVTKEMSTEPPRKIAKLKIVVSCPRTFEPHVIELLEKAAIKCPVHQSLHPDIVQEFVFQWGPV